MNVQFVLAFAMLYASLISLICAVYILLYSSLNRKYKIEKNEREENENE